MTNGQIDDVELELALSGDREKLDRYLATGIRELTETVKDLKSTCETRGKTCPAVVQAKATSTVVARVLDRIAMPVAVVLLTLVISRWIG